MSTTMTSSTVCVRSASTSSGLSCTMTRSPVAAFWAASSSLSIQAQIRGWRMPFSLARAAGSPNTISPSRDRSRDPSGRITSGPKASATCASPGVPGSTTTRAPRSPSMITAPCAASRLATSLLPDAMPPVSPTRNTRICPAFMAIAEGKPPAGARPGGQVCTPLAGPATQNSTHSRGCRLLSNWSGLAGQPLAESGQRLVRGQRAGRLGARGRAGRDRAARAGPRAAPATAGRPRGAARSRAFGVAVARRDRFLLVGLAGFLHLLAVRLEPGARLRVLVLPLLALLLVAVQPLARLRVEAVRVLVVALLVVGGRHAVEGRVEVVADRLADGALVGLLQRQADAPPVQVDVDDLDEDLVAHLHDLLGDLHVPVGQLGDVHQALDALLDPDERAEGHELGHPARHDLPDLVSPGELLPRVFLGGLQRQRDPLAVHVHVPDLDGDLLAHLDHLARVVDVLPGQLGHVHQAVHAAEVDERAEVDDRGDDALADLALGQGVEEGVADLGLGLLQPGPAGQHHVIAVLVQLDDLGLDLPADVRLQIADPAHLHQGGGQEAVQPDIQDQAALDPLDHRAGDDAVLVLDLLDRAPGPLVLGPLLGQDQAALLVLLLENEGLDVLAGLDYVVRVDIVLDRQFAGGNHAFCLVADVEQNLVSVDLYDCSFDDVTVVEILDGFVDRGEECLLGPDVVDRHLGGRVGLRAARHVWVGSGCGQGKFWTCRKPVHPSMTRIRRTSRNQQGPTTARPAAASPVT